MHTGTHGRCKCRFTTTTACLQRTHLAPGKLVTLQDTLSVRLGPHKLCHCLQEWQAPIMHCCRCCRPAHGRACDCGAGIEPRRELLTLYKRKDCSLAAPNFGGGPADHKPPAAFGNSSCKPVVGDGRAEANATAFRRRHGCLPMQHGIRRDPC